MKSTRNLVKDILQAQGYQVQPQDVDPETIKILDQALQSKYSQGFDDGFYEGNYTEGL